eukprot:gnl/Chilomastix_caulleri/5960.p1 GENE.gnl/Chilomastix_caulleri/5960~~gnl/Chilomastix_caulleri/5960.p1  ORF type:complete len:54 (+),score=3.30 gnl/Chilomastix_caulleri/5960:125-286(+)
MDRNGKLFRDFTPNYVFGSSSPLLPHLLSHNIFWPIQQVEGNDLAAFLNVHLG